MKKILWVILFLFFLGSLIWVLFFSYFTQIKKLEIVGDFSDEKAVRIFLEDSLKRKNWLAISFGNFFFFSEKDIENSLRERFPLIKKVEIRKKFPEEVFFSFESRQGVFVWCFGEKCYWVDANGELFFGPQNITEVEKTNYPIVLGKENGDRFLGEKVFSSELSAFLYEVTNLLKENDQFQIARTFVSPDIASNELRVSFLNGWQAYFNFKDSVALQVKTLERILKEKLKDVPEEKIEYIDLRISGRAIFKLREGEN